MSTSKRNIKDDPDFGLELKKSFIVELQRRLKEKRKLTPHSIVARRYGIR